MESKLHIFLCCVESKLHIRGVKTPYCPVENPSCVESKLHILNLCGVKTPYFVESKLYITPAILNMGFLRLLQLQPVKRRQLAKEGGHRIKHQDAEQAAQTVPKFGFGFEATPELAK